ncbi:MAG: nucleotidyltransferase family protein [Blastocatellia bacterium]
MKLNLADQILLSGLLPAENCRRRLSLLLAQEAAPDWATIVRRARLHLIAPLLRRQLALAGGLDHLPAPVRQELDEHCQGLAARELAALHKCRQLLGELAAAGITAIPLKGTALILSGCYPQPGLRPASDIDLLAPREQLAQAERIAGASGWRLDKDNGAPEPETEAPHFLPRGEYRLPSELNHADLRRGQGGLMLELHWRAFHFTRAGRDFGYDTVLERARPQRGVDGVSYLLPAPVDLALHLIHHTFVDLRSAQLILRTIADLYFIEQAFPGTLVQLPARAAAFRLGAAAAAAVQLLSLLRDGAVAEIEAVAAGLPGAPEQTALLESALLENPQSLALAAWMAEHFDLRGSLAGAAENIAAIVLTSREHLARTYDRPPSGRTGTAPSGRTWLYYPRRVLDVLRRFEWQSLHPATWRRLRRLRKISRPS